MKVFEKKPANGTFGNPALIEKYGSWIRVQVAFYDFIYQQASRMCASHFNDKAAESNKFYDVCTKNIEETFNTFEDAWEAFLDYQK